jgi:hypothetical protein
MSRKMADLSLFLTLVLREDGHPGAPEGWSVADPVETWAQSVLAELPSEMQDRLNQWGV